MPEVQELSLVDAARSILPLLQEERQPAEPERAAPTPERPPGKPGRERGPDGKFLATRTDAPLPITAADGTPDEGAEEAPKAEEVEPEPEKADAAEKEEIAEPPKSRLERVKVDGQEVEVEIEELKKGYSRTADYTRKTQELAKARERFEKEELAQVRAERQQYAERLAALAAIVQLPGEEPNWDDLRNRLSPEEFTTQFTEWRQAQARVERVRAEQERVFALQQADMDKQLASRLVDEHEKLKAALPDMADAEKGKALRADLIAYAKSPAYGWTDEDLAQVTDHRLLVLLDKARRYDEAQKRKPTIDATIDRALDTFKPSGATSRPKVSDVERARDALIRSGRVEDAAEYLKKAKLL